MTSACEVVDARRRLWVRLRAGPIEACRRAERSRSRHVAAGIEPMSRPSAVFRLSGGRGRWITIELGLGAETPLAADIVFRYMQRLGQALAGAHSAPRGVRRTPIGSAAPRLRPVSRTALICHIVTEATMDEIQTYRGYPAAPSPCGPPPRPWPSTRPPSRRRRTISGAGRRIWVVLAVAVPLAVLGCIYILGFHRSTSSRPRSRSMPRTTIPRSPRWSRMTSAGAIPAARSVIP